MSQDKHVCTKTDPWTPQKAPYARHPDAAVVGECLQGCCDKYKCPHCGSVFLREIPR